MATIQKRERKTGTVYRAMVRIHGFPDQQRTFKRLTDARIWAQQTEAAIRKGEFQNVVTKARNKTLKDVIERYRAEVLPHKAETTRRAEATYLAFWEKALGQYALSYIEPEAISRELGKLAEAGDSRRKPEKTEASEAPAKPKSRKTLKHYRDTLAVLFKHAKAWGWTANNPIDGVTPITKLRNERVRYLSEDERKRLLAACRESTNPQLYPVVVFALSTGARKNEILRLALNDVDLHRGQAVLRDTKNGETRSVPIVHHLADLLGEQKARAETLYAQFTEAPKTRYLFPRPDGLAPTDVRKAWENARDAAQLEDFRFHDLRHSTASYLAMRGASQLEIAQVLGHRTMQMVQRYAHLSDSHIKTVLTDLSHQIWHPTQ